MVVKFIAAGHTHVVSGNGRDFHKFLNAGFWPAVLSGLRTEAADGGPLYQLLLGFLLKLNKVYNRIMHPATTYSDYLVGWCVIAQRQKFQYAPDTPAAEILICGGQLN